MAIFSSVKKQKPLDVIFNELQGVKTFKAVDLQGVERDAVLTSVDHKNQAILMKISTSILPLEMLVRAETEVGDVEAEGTFFSRIPNYAWFTPSKGFITERRSEPRLGLPTGQLHAIFIADKGKENVKGEMFKGDIVDLSSGGLRVAFFPWVNLDVLDRGEVIIAEVPDLRFSVEMVGRAGNAHRLRTINPSPKVAYGLRRLISSCSIESLTKELNDYPLR